MHFYCSKSMFVTRKFYVFKMNLSHLIIKVILFQIQPAFDAIYALLLAPFMGCFFHQRCIEFCVNYRLIFASKTYCIMRQIQYVWAANSIRLRAKYSTSRARSRTVFGNQPSRLRQLNNVFSHQIQYVCAPKAY